MLKYKLCRVVDPSKEVPDPLLEAVDLKQEVPDLRSGRIPSPFNSCSCHKSLRRAGQSLTALATLDVPLRNFLTSKSCEKVR